MGNVSRHESRTSVELCMNELDRPKKPQRSSSSELHRLTGYFQFSRLGTESMSTCDCKANADLYLFSSHCRRNVLIVSTSLQLPFKEKIPIISPALLLSFQETNLIISPSHLLQDDTPIISPPGREFSLPPSFILSSHGKTLIKNQKGFPNNSKKNYFTKPLPH